MQHKLLKTTALLLFLHSTVACSTLKTNREKIIASMAVGLATGIVAGAAAKPEGDNATAWMLLGGAAGTAAGAGVGLYVFDDTKVTDSLRAENETLQAQLTKLKEENDPKLVEQGSSLMNAPLPGDAKGLIQPGGWKKYKMDRWVQDTENKNVWYRQVEMYEFNLPSVGGQ